MVTKQGIHSNLAIPPGEYLEEVITELGMSKDELARRMKRPAAKLSAIFKGEKAITPDTALQLEKVVGVPAHIWAGLESEYRLTLARLQLEKEKAHLMNESRLITKFHYNELVKLGYVAKKTNPAEKIFELQKFFGVTSLYNIGDLRRYQTAFRFGGKYKDKRSPEALAAWLRIGELEAQQTKCASFSRRTLERILPMLRSMTRKPPEDFETDLKKNLTDAGIALILCPHLPKTYAHGATFWLGREKAVLMMTLRGSWADIFWFSLFHEIGHLILHNRQSIFLEIEDDDSARTKQEIEADQFAASLLIPQENYNQFIKNYSFNSISLNNFADRLGIDAGIVVGRLQHDGHLNRSWHNKLRSRYAWAKQEH